MSSSGVPSVPTTVLTSPSSSKEKKKRFTWIRMPVVIPPRTTSRKWPNQDPAPTTSPQRQPAPTSTLPRRRLSAVLVDTLRRRTERLRNLFRRPSTTGDSLYNGCFRTNARDPPRPQTRNEICSRCLNVWSYAVSATPTLPAYRTEPVIPSDGPFPYEQIISLYSPAVRPLTSHWDSLSRFRRDFLDASVDDPILLRYLD
ncbi:hypothetical protein SpCBS45565_g08513 [Spizellomyces sp. 'palustris']|nr:hypothetical protein SpCBS45565_g08513 [Spizellomyces sp. 'palustris']